MGAPMMTMTASIMCTFGAAPGTFVVTPENKVMASNKPVATIMDNVPMKNIMPFGMCMSPSNPTVASATAAALGVLTPMPCVPATASPWIPGSPTVMVANKPALNGNCKLMCSYGGVISATVPGQFTAMVP
jgi:hypothetical protein